MELVPRGQIPENIGSPGHWQALDLDFLLALKDILPDLKVCRLEETWKKFAYKECLETLLNSENMKRLDFWLPTCPGEQRVEIDSKLTVPATCKIKELTIDTTAVIAKRFDE